MRRSGILHLLTIICLSLTITLTAADPKTKWLSKKPIIKAVEIIGNKDISTKTIKSAISTKESGFWQKLGLKKRNRLRKDGRVLDGAALDYLYKSAGYLDLKYDFEFEVAKDSSALVKIIIHEGNRYLIKGVVLPEDLGQKYKRIAKLTERLKPGEPLNPNKIKAILTGIKGIYANDGYPYANVDYKLLPSVGDTLSEEIVFNIEPGPLTVFGEVRVDSLKHTSSRLVKRELLFKPGDLYSRNKIIDSRQRIYSTGLFTYVDITTDLPTDSHEVSPKMIITCTEKKPRFVRIQTGAGQDSTYDLVWQMALEIGSRNVSGLGRIFRIMPSAKFRVFTQWRVFEEKFSFEFTEPWPFGLRMPIHLGLSWEPGLRDPIHRYKIETISLSISTLKEIGLFIKLKTGFEFQKVNISGVSESDLQQFKQDQEISVGRSFWFSFERDSRPNIFVPTSGAVTSLSGQFFGGFLGGDKNFLKLVGEWSRYLELATGAIYATRMKSGWIKSFEADKFVPSTDRFYLGGANTIRGYRENEVGPKTAMGEPEGGTFYLINNHELRHILFGKIWGSLFLDIGGNWNDQADFHFKDLLASAGLGLQYLSPMGPIRLDYGQRIAWKPVTPGGRFHISILYAF